MTRNNNQPWKHHGGVWMRSWNPWYFRGLFRSWRNPNLSNSSARREGRKAQPRGPGPGFHNLMYRGIKGAYLDPGLGWCRTAADKPWSISKLLKTSAGAGGSFSVILIFLLIPVCYAEEKQGTKCFPWTATVLVEKSLHKFLPYIRKTN